MHSPPFRLVQELGEGSWSSIAVQFPGRIGKQCRERWNNQLRPDIRRDAWTQAEEELLVEAHRKLGNRYVLSTSLYAIWSLGNHFSACVNMSTRCILSWQQMAQYCTGGLT